MHLAFTGQAERRLFSIEWNLGWFARKQRAAAPEKKPAGRPWLRLDNEALWTTVWTVGR
jgi:hypothetical protein